jgi:hypothetical protein
MTLRWTGNDRADKPKIIDFCDERVCKFICQIRLRPPYQQSTDGRLAPWEDLYA